MMVESILQLDRYIKMIIDFHTHIGKKVDKTCEDLLRSMDESGIEKAVVIAGPSDITGLSNRELLSVLNKHSTRFYGVLAINPLDLVNKEVDAYRNELDRDNVLGYKFYTGYHHYYPEDIKNFSCLKSSTFNDWGFVKTEQSIFLTDLIQAGKFAMFHTGDTYCACGNAKLKYAHPLGIDDVATDFPELKIVMAHLGYPWHRDAAEVMYKNKNVYADISGFVYNDFTNKDKKNFEIMIEEYARVNDDFERLLFGTDFPISNQKSYVQTLKEIGLFDKLIENNNKFIDSILKRQV